MEETTTNGNQQGADPATAERGGRSLDRVTAADLMLIRPEKEGWPQVIGALAVLDGRSMVDTDGAFRIEALRESVGHRLHLVPRFRQALYRPRRGLGWPVWGDAQSFDIADHVRVHPVPSPGDELQLLLACERLRRRPLHRGRPLWEMWFLTGLSDDRVGFFIKVHHAIADGVAGVATLAAFFDPAPDPPEISAPPWTPAPVPNTRELFQDNLRRRLGELDRMLTALAKPVATTRRILRSWPAVQELFAGGQAPRTSVNRRIGSDRRLAVVRGSLDGAKRVAHVRRATVNDVLLTAVAAGYADLFSRRGEPTDGVILRAFVPVSLHQEQPGAARGTWTPGCWCRFQSASVTTSAVSS